VSLILEALRKLEKEKATADRGFVVLGAASWPAPAARRWPLAAGAALLILAAAGAWWMVERRPAGTNAVAASPTPAAVRAAPPVSVASGLPAAPVPPPALRKRPVRASVERRAAVVPSPAEPPVPVSTPPAGPAPRPVSLQAITARDGRPMALVNDRLMGEGDEIEGIRVLAIRADEVDVEVDGRRRTLRF
jgi:hypothetical protein